MASSHLPKAIENPTLELKVVSASDLNHVDATDKMDVYAVVSVNDETKQAAKTPIDYDGGPNPTWNHTVTFTVNEEAAREGLITLKVELFSYWLEGKDDIYLGDVNVSVHELLASNPLPPFANGNVNKMKSLTCPIKVTEGGSSTNAKLSLLYRFKPVPVEDSYPLLPQDHSPSIGRPVYPHPDPKISVQPVIVSPPLQTTTTKLILEIVIKVAKNIEDVNAFLAMDVYASVAICKDKKVKDRINTPVAFSADTNPKWNQMMKFLIDEKVAQEGRLMLLVELMSHRPFLGDKEIGSVRLPIRQLLGSNPPSSSACGEGNGMKLETHALTGPYGKKGVVSFTYRFLAQQVRVATVPTPSTTSQPCVMYLPVSSHYPSHGYQQYIPPKQESQMKPQPLLPQHSEVKPLPQQQFTQSLSDTQEA
ncbi:unnamed protein product [Eruca vesicaria subsp. sativa]|uniref:C2 domain-containing protein n=1 Tax=Eruca vesicaria subsp. sativa TaxID=29727 RepID=A0ABC8J823_ERUVS|nr:unnamed protein product [Eruca vesicaria subsp. sativa]